MRLLSYRVNALVLLLDITDPLSTWVLEIPSAIYERAYFSTAPQQIFLSNLNFCQFERL